MISHNILSTLSLVPGVIVFIELFARLPVRKHLRTFRSTATRAFRVIRSPRISDHWKEKALPAYAGKMLISSLLSLLYLIISLGMACFVLLLTSRLIFENTAAFIDFLFTIRAQLGLVVTGLVYARLRLP